MLGEYLLIFEEMSILTMSQKTDQVIREVEQVILSDPIRKR